MNTNFEDKNVVNYDFLKKYNTNIEKLEFRQTPVETIKINNHNILIKTFEIKNYDDFLNDIELIIELDDPEHLINSSTINDIINRHECSGGGWLIERHDKNINALLKHLYSKDSKFYYNKKSSKCLITIPLLYDLTTDQNFFLPAKIHKFEVRVEFNSSNVLFNKNLKVHLKYKTGKFNNNFDIYDKPNDTFFHLLFNQIKNHEYTLTCKDNKFICYQPVLNLPSHCIIFKFNNYKPNLSKTNKNIRLYISDYYGSEKYVVKEYDLKELRINNWKNIGLEPPKDDYYIITFCKHTLNNYKNEDCTAFNLSKHNVNFEIITEGETDGTQLKLNILYINKNIAIFNKQMCGAKF